MRRVLQVSRNGFYTWRRRPESPRANANRSLVARMRVLHQPTHEAFGTRKMAAPEARRPGLWPASGARLQRLAGSMALRRWRYLRTVRVRQHERRLSPIAFTSSLPCQQ